MTKRPAKPRKRAPKAPVELPSGVVHELEEAIRITVDISYYGRRLPVVGPNPFEEMDQ